MGEDLSATKPAELLLTILVAENRQQPDDSETPTMLMAQPASTLTAIGGKSRPRDTLVSWYIHLIKGQQ
jgi:hypothetical protein